MVSSFRTAIGEFGSRDMDQNDVKFMHGKISTRLTNHCMMNRLKPHFVCVCVRKRER